MSNSAFKTQSIATPVTVDQGGTGDASLTAYAPLFGGTTSTGSVQSGTVGTTGQVLTSNGAGALPTFQDITSITSPNTIPVRGFSTLAVAQYTDDVNHIASKSNANGTIGIINSLVLCAPLTGIDYLKYISGVAQNIARPTIDAGSTVTTGVIIQGGYIYVTFDTGTMWRALVTSDISNIANWTQLTISGTSFGSTTDGIVGYGNGNFWVTITGTGVVPYTLSGTTMTSGTTVTVSGASYNSSFFRVNGTGIYAYFTTAPKVQFADFTGTLDGNKQVSAANINSQPGIGLPNAMYIAATDPGTNGDYNLLSKLSF